MQRASRVELPIASKKLKRFRNDTKKLIADKTDGGGRWAGFKKTLPPLRRRPGVSRMIVREGLAAPQAQAEGEARKRQLRETAARLHGTSTTRPAPVTIDLMLVDDDEEAPQAAPKYRKVSQPELETATRVKVHSGSDLLHGDPEVRKLHAWLSIVARGLSVVPRNSEEIAFKSALSEPHALAFSDRFINKHCRLTSAFGRYCAREDSNWTIAASSSDASSAKGVTSTRVDSLEDFRAWLISARRFSSWAGVTVDGIDARRGSMTRYGRPQA